MAKVIAIIPARGGSKGVPKKNIKSLGGYPLISYSIIAARLCSGIDRVIVSTDCPEIASIAKLFGAEVPFLRPESLAQDSSVDKDFIIHLLDWLKEHEGKVPEYLVQLRPTTPLRDPQVINEAIELMKQNIQASSLRSGHPTSESPFKWFMRNDEGYFHSISSQYSNEDINKPRQIFPEVYVPNGYVDVLKCEFILKEGKLHGEKMMGFISPVCHQVDTAKDFEYLEYEIIQKKSQLLEYLTMHYSQEANQTHG